ncbi:1153_t:CDS:1, partial [Acaulospora colombiana]
QKRALRYGKHCFNNSQEWQRCVKELIQGLQPLPDVINNYINATYPALYTK